MLADSINFPLVAGFGFAVFGLLTVLVTLLECVAFRIMLGTAFRDTFSRLLVANILSAVAGGITYAFQDRIVDAAGIRGSIPEFVAGYTWVGGLLILIYFLKSLLVETPVVATRFVASRIGRTRGGVVKAVVAGNILSYLLVGPLFYYSTRPTFGRVDTFTSTDWTANRDLAVYFIDPQDHFIKRIRADGTGLETLVPYTADLFLVSEDGKAYVYQAREDDLYVCRDGDERPTLVWKHDEWVLMHSVSLSPDKETVAYAEELPMQNGHHSVFYRLNLFVIESGETAETLISRPDDRFMPPPVSWSRDGMQIYARCAGDDVAVIRGTPPWDLVEQRPAESLRREDLVVNHVRFNRKWYSGSGSTLSSDRKGAFEIVFWSGLMGHTSVTENGEPRLTVWNDYGLLKLGIPGPRNPSFLPNGTEAILEWWGQLYILDFERRRLGLLVEGGDYVLPTDRFRVQFGKEDTEANEPSQMKVARHDQQ